MSIKVTTTSANMFYQNQLSKSNNQKFINSIYNVPNPDEESSSATTDSYHTKKYKQAQMRLDNAERELLSEINTIANQIAETNDPTEKDELRKKLSDLYRIKEVRKSVQTEISEGGNISFKFSNSVNVEDFKKAFGIQEGKLRDYLRDRHDDAEFTNDINIVYSYNTKVKNTRYTIYEYSDGCKIKHYHNEDGEGNIMDYTAMELGPDDNGLEVKYNKLKK